MSPTETYRVQENTENSAHPSIDDVIDLTLERAATPRPEQNKDGHFDQYVNHAVEAHGESAVTECIRLILVEGFSHRSAGAAAFGTENYVRGIEVGVACSAYLQELLGERPTDE